MLIKRFSLSAILAIATLVFATAATVYGDPPAVMFLIDHSTSMSTQSGSDCQSNGCDPNGNRFRVTQALIDSIYAIYPDAEVGIVIFSNGLVLDSDRDANLVRYPDVYANDSFGSRQSYMPLKPLNATANLGGTNPFYTGPGIPTVYDVYRNMFTITNRWEIRNGPAEIAGTNISLAFAAALKAFESTSIPKKDQYIIFLSDGYPLLNEERTGVCTGHIWCGRGEEFAVGTNTPTTYTFYLTTGNTRALPDILVTMTNNVRMNGYSETNLKSGIWAVNSGYDDLLALMMDNIVGGIVSVLTPDRVVPPPSKEEATVIAPMVILSSKFTAGPNPVLKQSGMIKFYRQGKQVASSELRIYDATGNVINKIKISDNAISTQAKRQVGSWDLKNKNGKIVSDGTYLLKGTLKTRSGEKEKISVILGVR